MLLTVYLGPGVFGLSERPRLLRARNFSAAFIRVLQNRSLDEAAPNMLVGSDGDAVKLLLLGRELGPVPGVSGSLVSVREL